MMPECILWDGETRNGYGVIRIDGRKHYAHRVVYMTYVDEIGADVLVHHRCDEKLCVNPWHLEAVTARQHYHRHPENLIRARARNVERARSITHCPRGHAYDDANTYVDPTGGRRCRECARQRQCKAL